MPIWGQAMQRLRFSYICASFYINPEQPDPASGMTDVVVNHPLFGH